MKLKNIGIKSRLVLKKLFLDIRHVHLKDLRNWFLYSLKKMPDVVHLKNLVLFSGIISVVILVLFVQRFDAINAYTTVKKPSFGGNYTGGVVGGIDQINPLFTQNDAEKSAVKLVYSGLTRVDETGKAIPDLASSWKVDATGKVYDFTLRKNIKWHDGVKFNADDVIYTFGAIQDTDTKTPLYDVWQGVKVEKTGEYSVRFTLSDQYPDFPSIASQPIIAKHIYGKVADKNIKIAEDNTSPVGTGPYKFSRFDQLGAQSEAVFTRNSNFALGEPYIGDVRLVTYDTDDALFDGLKRRQIDGAMAITPNNYDEISKLSNLHEYSKYLPGYEMVYMNTRNTLLSNLDLRKVIVESVNRHQVAKVAASGRAQDQWGPIIPGMPGYDSKVKQQDVDQNAATNALVAAGWVKDKNGVFAKDGKELSFRLISPDTSENISAASEIKSELKKVGINIEVKAVDPNQISSSYIRPRNFDLLLLNQSIGYGADWYSLWDSSQVTSPGLNLSGLSDKGLDKFVEQARKAVDPKLRSDRLKQASEVIVQQAPVVYLYRPETLTFISEKVNGVAATRISSSLDYLNTIYHWYISTTSS